MKNLTLHFTDESIWLQGRALWERDCETLFSIERQAGKFKEIHVDIEYMSCCFSKALYIFLSRLGNANIYWHIRDPFYVHADLPVLFSEISGLPIKLIPGTSLAMK